MDRRPTRSKLDYLLDYCILEHWGGSWAASSNLDSWKSLEHAEDLIDGNEQCFEETELRQDNGWKHSPE